MSQAILLLKFTVHCHLPTMDFYIIWWGSEQKHQGWHPQLSTGPLKQ